MTDGPWLKIIGFVIVATMLGGITMMLLDPGTGKPTDEARRFAHPKGGFSMVGPRGWAPEISLAQDGPNAESIIFLEPSKMGIQSTIAVTRLPAGWKSIAETRDGSVATTFQGRPARALVEEKRNRWQWTLAFTMPDADRGNYEIVVVSRIRQDYDAGPLRAFIDTFRPGTEAGASTQPTNEPASAPTDAG